MAAGSRKSLADIVAELDDPAAKDVDPESFGGAFDLPASSDNGAESAGDEDNDGREHYQAVGQSRLRKPTAPTLGPQYAGSKVSRNALGNGFDDEGYIDDDDDDPFARKGSPDSDIDSRDGEDDVDEDESAADYDNPSDVDLDKQVDIDEDIDSDEAFGEGDEEVFKKKGFTFRGSGKSATDVEKGITVDEGSGDEFGGFDEDDDVGMKEMSVTRLKTERQGDTASEESDEDDEDTELDSEMSENNVSDAETDTDGTSPEEREYNAVDRAALREMMAAEQKSVVASISEATRADAAKGTAVKQQYGAFDSLIGTRIQLQKALIAANSLSAVPATVDPSTHDEALAAAAQSAESAALTLLNSITALQQDLSNRHQPASKESRKRPFAAILSTPLESIHSALSSPSLTSIQHHRSTLTKWSNKTQSATTLPSRNKLIAQTSTQQPLTSVLDSYLLQGSPSMDRLIQKTQTPRSCAPLQQQEQQQKQQQTTPSTTASNNAHPSIFDDADFYALQLQELIEHKKSYTSNASNTSTLNSTSVNAALDPSIVASASLRPLKQHRKNVDTKASKGRKMRYTVHEKLLNFVAPTEEPVGGKGWRREAAEELFRGLFGRRRVGNAVVEMEMEVEKKGDGEEDGGGGLRLFAER